MSHISKILFTLTACLSGQAVLLHAEFQVPPLKAPVNDTAGMLPADTADNLIAPLSRSIS